MSQPQPQQEQGQEQPIPPHLDPKTYPRTLQPTPTTHLTLTYHPLDPSLALTQISSPSAGANVLFLGTTRDSFDNRRVTQLSYTSYPTLALKTLDRISRAAVSKHGLVGISIVHRLGIVPVGEASIVVAVSSGHRGAAWRAGEEVLEECKANLEVWKMEEFEDGGEGEWRANRDWDSEGGRRKKRADPGTSR